MTYRLRQGQFGRIRLGRAALHTAALTRPAPSESSEQRSFVAWAKAMAEAGVYPELAWLYAVPNGGLRSKVTAIRMRAEGVSAGYPDMGLDVARRGYHALRLELKAPSKRAALTPAQRTWLTHLSAEGYACVVPYGVDAARAAVVWYLTARDAGDVAREYGVTCAPALTGVNSVAWAEWKPLAMVAGKTADT